MTRQSKLANMMQAIQSVQPDEDLRVPRDNKVARSQEAIQHINLSRIYVNAVQFRKYFDPEEQEKLKNTIQRHGFQGAILLRPIPHTLKEAGGHECDFELIYGESRYQAVRDLGGETIPAIIRDLDDQQTRRIRLDENLVRKDLNPLEETEGLLEIAADELGVSTKRLISLLDEVENCKRRNKPLKKDSALLSEKFQAVLDYYKKGSLASFRTKYQKLQRLPDDIKGAVQETLSWSKAVEIAPVKDPKIRQELLEWVIRENPSVAEIRKRRRALKWPAGKDHPHGGQRNAVRSSFYKGLATIRSSDEWSKPKNQERIQHLIKEIEDIFHVKIS